MIAMPNSYLVLHKKNIKTTLKNKISINHCIKIINLGGKKLPCRKEWAKNCKEKCKKSTRMGAQNTFSASTG